jgi:murein DD-endopeptidase MepM/ murein hydrolase activator NlpD
MNKLKIPLFLFFRRFFISTKQIRYHLKEFFKKILDRKTIFLISKLKIRSYSIGPIFQIIILCFALWVGNIFNNSLNYNSTIKQKSVEIKNLKKINQQFASEIDLLNHDVQKINHYFNSIAGYNLPPSKDLNLDIVNKKVIDIFGGAIFDREASKIATRIASSNLLLDNIKGATFKRINDLEQKLSIAGIALVNNKVVLIKNSNIDTNTKDIISLNNKNELYKRQGGPFQNLKKSMNSAIKSNTFNISKFNIEDEIKDLANLENIISKLPFIAPMKNYYVSSGFGERIDPIKNITAKHEGIDFVGINKAKIISPSDGKVIFAGKFGTYGNALIIDHGYGITTRYGHLSNIFINKGSYVKKEQVIATQGSTGRSTGQHLHYEVRYKNITLNPRNFLEAGTKIIPSTIGHDI